MIQDELMIGDWIYNNDSETIEKVNCILCDVIHTNCSDDVSLDDVSPIRITSEILKMNGFKYHCIPTDGIHSKQEFYQYEDKEKTVSVKMQLYDDWKIYAQIFWGEYEFSNSLSGHIKSVHELQHALRLCHIDKEIRL